MKLMNKQATHSRKYLLIIQSSNVAVADKNGIELNTFNSYHFPATW